MDNDNGDSITDSLAADINERLSQIEIAQLSGQEQIQLADMIECVSVVEKQRRSMDGNGARFLLFFRQHALRKGHGKDINLSWREINWAYHSTSQDILSAAVSRQFQNRMLWEHARESGMFMWLTDLSALVSNTNPTSYALFVLTQVSRGHNSRTSLVMSIQRVR